MIAAHAFTGRTVAVFGLARTGLGAVTSLLAGGAEVIAWDDNSAARDAGGMAGAEIMPWREWPWEKIAALILSPGVPLTHPKPHEVVGHASAAKRPGDRRCRTCSPAKSAPTRPSPAARR